MNSEWIWISGNPINQPWSLTTTSVWSKNSDVETVNNHSVPNIKTKGKLVAVTLEKGG